MKVFSTIISLLFPFLTVFGQNTLGDVLEEIQGVWIASDFKHSFDSTGSMIQSKQSFDGHIPVGLRINPSEIEGNILNLGLGRLHSHIIHPEVSKYVATEKDTFYSMGFYNVPLNQVDSAGYYSIPDIFNYAISAKAYLKIISSKEGAPIIELVREPTEHIEEIKIRYERIADSFTEDYPFPNPRDYYVRGKALSGIYELYDGYGKKLSDNFIIKQNGICSGYSELDGQKIDFSTDVYCGDPNQKFDLIIVYNEEESHKTRSFDADVFIYQQTVPGQIKFFNWKSESYERVIDKTAYTLIKKK